MHPHALIYSSDENTTLGKLKKGEGVFEIDPKPIQKWMEEHNVWSIVEGEPEFHYKFQSIPSKPYIIYYQGDISLLDRQILAVVGPRQHTEYAQKIIEHLFSILPQYDVVTVSWLAPWIDQLTHRLSLKQGIPTIAILWWGLQRYQKSPDRYLIQEIIEGGGLVLSEFRLSLEPQSYTFPQRNRIIAGLADMVFVPEAGKKSWSLITVEFAHKMRKPIYGVPNSFFSLQSEGLHEGIAKGMIQITTNIEDMIQRYFCKIADNVKKRISFDNLPVEEQAIMHCLQQKKEIQIEEFINILALNHWDLLVYLTRLEIDHLVYQTSPGTYSLP